MLGIAPPTTPVSPGQQGPAGLLEYRWGSDPAPSVTGNRWLDHRITLNSATNAFGQHLVQQSSTLTKIRVGVFTPIAASAVTYTLQVNGVDSSLTVTVAAGASSGVATGSVAVSAGDLLSLKANQATASAVDAGIRVVVS